MLLVFYLGAIVGITGMARLEGTLFEHYKLVAHILIAGLVLGSAVFVWPFDAEWGAQARGLPLAALVALVPLLLGWLRSRME